MREAMRDEPTLAQRLERFVTRQEVYVRGPAGKGWWVTVHAVDLMEEAMELMRLARISMLPKILPTTPAECRHGYDVCPECDAALLDGDRDA